MKSSTLSNTVENLFLISRPNNLVSVKIVVVLHVIKLVQAGLRVNGMFLGHVHGERLVARARRPHDITNLGALGGKEGATAAELVRAALVPAALLGAAAARLAALGPLVAVVGAVRAREAVADAADIGKTEVEGTLLAAETDVVEAALGVVELLERSTLACFHFWVSKSGDRDEQVRC